MATVLNGRGLRVRRWNGSVYVDVPLVRDVSNVNPGQREIRDVTNQDTAQGRDAKIAGINRGGEIRVPVFWDPTDPVHLALEADQESGAEVLFQIKYPPAGSSRRVMFGAIVREVPVAVPVSDEVTGDMVLEVTGAVTKDTGV